MKVEPARGLECSGISKPRRISAFNGPAAGGGYVLRTGLKVKAGRGPYGVKATPRFIRQVVDPAGRSRHVSGYRSTGQVSADP